MALISSSATINAIRLAEQGSTPSTPAANHSTVFAKSDGLYIVDDGGNVTGPFVASSGNVATDAIWDAAGDIVVGTGSNTAGRKALGTAKQVLSVNAGATDVEWALPGLTLIEDQTLGGDVSSVVFPSSGSLPTIYSHLEIVWYARGSTAAYNAQVSIRFNADSGNNYYGQKQEGAATTLAGAETLAVAQALCGFMPANSATANMAGSGHIVIPNYLGTTFFKTFTATYGWYAHTSSGNTHVGTAFGAWSNTNAITTVTLIPGADNFKAGSRFTMYGLR